jgi:hypothetical protein
VPATILTLLLSLLCGGAAWLLLGTRLALDAVDTARNDVLNVLAYVAIAAPIAFGVVFFILGAS